MRFKKFYFNLRITHSDNWVKSREYFTKANIMAFIKRKHVNILFGLINTNYFYYPYKRAKNNHYIQN